MEKFNREYFESIPLEMQFIVAAFKGEFVLMQRGCRYLSTFWAMGKEVVELCSETRTGKKVFARIIRKVDFEEVVEALTEGVRLDLPKGVLPYKAGF